MNQRILYAGALALGVAALAVGCNDDAGVEDEAGEATETGDGDPGDGDGDGDPGDGDGDSGDGDGDGDQDSPCGWEWEVTEMKVNGQTHAAYDVAIAANGDFAAVGRIENADFDAWVALFGPDGARKWEHFVDGGEGSDTAVGVGFDAAGDVVLVGNFARALGDELWIEKRSAAAGEVVWTVTEASEFEGDNAAGEVALAPDGGLLVSATIRAGDQDADISTRKLDAANGATIWTAAYSGSPDANGFSIDAAGPIAVAADGTVYVGGSEGVDFETKEGVLLQYGPEGGAPQWVTAPKASGQAHVHDVYALAGGPEGEAYFVIHQSGNVPGFWLGRISPAGEIEWELSHEDFVYAPTDSWVVAGLALAEDGSLTVGGRLINEEVGQAISWSEAWIANVSRAGVGQCVAAHTWQNTHIIPAQTFGYGLAEGPYGAVVVGEVVDGPENYLWLGGFK